MKLWLQGSTMRGEPCRTDALFESSIFSGNRLLWPFLWIERLRIRLTSHDRFESGVVPSPHPLLPRRLSKESRTSPPFREADQHLSTCAEGWAAQPLSIACYGPFVFCQRILLLLAVHNFAFFFSFSNLINVFLFSLKSFYTFYAMYDIVPRHFLTFWRKNQINQLE